MIKKGIKSERCNRVGATTNRANDLLRDSSTPTAFADYKDKVIDLLMRVTTVSVRTVTIIELMKNVDR